MFLPRRVAPTLLRRVHTLSYTAHHPATPPAPPKSPLVILHGLFGSKSNYTSLSRSLTDRLGRSVYCVDLVNHGESPHSTVSTQVGEEGGGMGYMSMARDVEGFLKERELEDVVLVGHSMGGKVAMSTTLLLNATSPPSHTVSTSTAEEKRLIGKLVVIDISPAVGPVSNEFKKYIQAMLEIERREVRSRKEADEILQEYEPNLGVRQFLLTNLTRDGSSTKEPYKFRIPLEILEKGIEEIGDFPFEAGKTSWAGEVLVVKGAKSKYINRHNIPIFEQYFPNMKLVTLDTGHWVQAERPKEFIEALAEFCE